MSLELKNYDPAVAAGANIGVSVDLTDITDSNGNEAIEIDGVTSAVNYLRTTNSATGDPVILSAQGDDTNVGLDLDPKGTGALRILSGATTGNSLDLIAGSSTTGTLIDVSDADALTTGFIANLTSNSSDTSTRTLVKIVNDHASATGTTPLTVQQDAAATIIKLDGVLGTPTFGIDAAVIGSANHVFKVPATTSTPGQPLTIGTATATGAIKIDVAGTSRYIFFYT